MKRSFSVKSRVTAASENHKVEITYAQVSQSSSEILLRTMTIDGADLRAIYIKALESIELDVNIDYDDLADYGADEILEEIEYANGQGDNDYIFLMKVDGKTVIDQTAPEENYHV